MEIQEFLDQVMEAREIMNSVWNGMDGSIHEKDIRNIHRELTKLIVQMESIYVDRK